MKKLFTLVFLILGLNLNAQQTVELCPETNTTFTYSSNAGVNGVYTWTIGSDTFIGNSFTYTWTEEGQYVVNLYFVSNAGCTDTISYNVLVIPCQDTYVYTPNSFTPNGDGLNDVFNIYGYNFSNPEMFIYNRWGELIYNSKNLGWDGTYKGNPCQQDVYVYLIKWVDARGKLKQIVGHLTLLR